MAKSNSEEEQLNLIYTAAQLVKKESTSSIDWSESYYYYCC
jgi:hypothetical protein